MDQVNYSRLCIANTNEIAYVNMFQKWFCKNPVVLKVEHQVRGARTHAVYHDD